MKDKLQETELSHSICLFKEDGSLVSVLKIIYILPYKSFQSFQAIHSERLTSLLMFPTVVSMPELVS